MTIFCLRGCGGSTVACLQTPILRETYSGDGGWGGGGGGGSKHKLKPIKYSLYDI